MNTQVRNLLLKNFGDFIKAVYGESKYGIWLNNLKSGAKELYTADKFTSRWYDAEEFYTDPMIVLCRIFDKGHTEAAWQSGAWGVAGWLKGRIMWIFEKLNTELMLKTFLPQAAIHYYRPVKIKEITVKKGEAVIYVEGMHGAENLLAFRFGGGLEKTLQIKGCKDVTVQIGSCTRKNAECTAFFVNWK